MPFKDPNARRKYSRRWARQRRLKDKQRLLRLAGKHTCEICGEARIWCLEFHHVDPEAKEFAIGKAPTNISRTRLMQEIEGCMLVCKNCHADVHNQWEVDV